MAEAGVYELRRQVARLRRELARIGTPSDMPELISSANLVRANETLTRSGAKKDELIAAYGSYAAALEGVLSDVFEIQNGLRDIVREQSSMIAGGRAGSRARTGAKARARTGTKPGTKKARTGAKSGPRTGAR